MKFYTLLAVAGILLYQSACSPVYKEQITKNQPQGQAGRECVAKCDKEKAQCMPACVSCNQREAMLSKVKAAEAKIKCDPFAKNYDWCLGLADAFYQPRDGEQFDACKEICANCQVTSDQCFVDCGGTIEKKQVCTAFCGDAAKAEPAGIVKSGGKTFGEGK